LLLITNCAHYAHLLSQRWRDLSINMGSTRLMTSFSFFY